MWGFKTGNTVLWELSDQRINQRLTFEHNWVLIIKSRLTSFFQILDSHDTELGIKFDISKITILSSPILPIEHSITDYRTSLSASCWQGHISFQSPVLNENKTVQLMKDTTVSNNLESHNQYSGFSVKFSTIEIGQRPSHFSV